MAYAAGGLIQATDYNNLAWGGTQGTYTATPNNIAYVMGIGQGAIGYGQSVSAINTVSTVNSVTAVQWSGLLTTLNSALAHQQGAAAVVATTPTITAGNNITYFANIATQTTNINTNAALFASQGATLTGTVFSVTLSAAVSVALNSVTDRFVTWASPNAARYFFNSGGQLNYVIATNTSNGLGRSGSVAAMVTGMGGVVAFRNTTNGGRTGTGSTLNTNNTAIGYRSQTVINTPITIVQVTDTTATYTTNTALIQVYTNDITNTNGSVGPSVFLRTAINIAADDAFAGAVSINLTTRVDIVHPETTYLTNAWGTPTIT